MNTAQGFGQRVGRLSPNQGPPVLVGRGRCDRDRRGRLRLGWLGHRRLGKEDGRSGRGVRARPAGGDRLRRPVPIRRRRPGPARGAQAAAGLGPQLVHREGRMGADAGQGQADQHRHAALRRPAGGPLAVPRRGRAPPRPGPRSSHRVDRSRWDGLRRACRCARRRNPRDEPSRAGPVERRHGDDAQAGSHSTWRPRSRHGRGRSPTCRRRHARPEPRQRAGGGW